MKFPLGSSFSTSHEALFTLTAAVEFAQLRDNSNGEILHTSFEFQTEEETTKLYFIEGRMIWASSLFWQFQSPDIVYVEQQNGEVVTVVADYYLTAESGIYLLESPVVHEHSPHDTLRIEFPIDNSLRWRKSFIMF